jgi:formylglycine-generating enzyme required for sulfatase activity
MITIKGSRYVTRGGNWSNLNYFCSVSYRTYDYPLFRSISLGFRVAIGGVK